MSKAQVTINRPVPSHRAASPRHLGSCARVSFTNPFTTTATMAPVFNRADNELRRPLGRQSSANRRRLDVEENRPARDLGAENPNTPHGDDYEYDEAHDVPAGPLGENSCATSCRSPAPEGEPRRGTGTMDTTRPTISAPPEQPTPDIASMSEFGRTAQVAMAVDAAGPTRGR